MGISTSVYSQDTSVSTLSEGACWYEQGETIKIASFNDRESISTGRDDIEYQVESLISAKKNKAITSDLTLHCGGYGASLVVKTEIDSRAVCLWLKFNAGKLEIRSIGGLEDKKSDLCDGYKWGELIVGVNTLDQKLHLESVEFSGLIKSVSVISGKTLKLVLNESYHGREIEAMLEIKKQIAIKYIELNLYQHPIGEAALLK